MSIATLLTIFIALGGWWSPGVNAAKLQGLDSTALFNRMGDSATAHSGGAPTTGVYYEDHLFGTNASGWSVWPWYTTYTPGDFNSAFTSDTGYLDHPGVWSVYGEDSGAGARFVLGHFCIQPKIGDSCVITWRTLRAESSVIYFGFTTLDGDGGTNTDVGPQAMLRWRRNGTAMILEGKCRQEPPTWDSTLTTRKDTFSNGTWYKSKLKIIAPGYCSFENRLFSNGSLLWADTVKSNVPLAPNNRTGCMLVAVTANPAGNSRFFSVDWFCMGLP